MVAEATAAGEFASAAAAQKVAEALTAVRLREEDAARLVAAATAAGEAATIAAAAREVEAAQKVAEALAGAEQREAMASRLAAKATSDAAVTDGIAAEAVRKAADASLAIRSAAEREAAAAAALADASAAALAAEHREICAQQLQAALGVEVEAFEEAKGAEARLAAKRQAAPDPDQIFEMGWFGKVKGQQAAVKGHAAAAMTASPHISAC